MIVSFTARVPDELNAYLTSVACSVLGVTIVRALSLSMAPIAVLNSIGLVATFAFAALATTFTVLDGKFAS